MEVATVIVVWAGDGTQGNEWRPKFPASMPQGSKWEDISTVDGIGIPGGSTTYTIRVTAPSTFIDQLETEPGLVVEWREDPGADRQPGAQATVPGFVDFAVELVTENLYPDLASVVQVFGLDTNKTWGQIAIEGIVNQVLIGNSDPNAPPKPAAIPNAAALEAML